MWCFQSTAEGWEWGKLRNGTGWEACETMCFPAMGMQACRPKDLLVSVHRGNANSMEPVRGKPRCHGEASGTLIGLSNITEIVVGTVWSLF